MKEVFGYICKLDIDGSIKLKSQIDYNSNVVFDGSFARNTSEIYLQLKQAHLNVKPVLVKLEGDTVVAVKIMPEEKSTGY